MTAKLFVIAAPSGAGKTSLVKALTDKHKQVTVAVSHTTRNKRPDEQDGINYYFVDKAAFKSMEAEKGFVESALVFGNSYGTSHKEVNRILESGRHLVLEIDWQGATQIRAQLPESESIFIMPPSMAALRERLKSRAQDDDDTIQSRMDEAISEMSHFNEFDHLIINDDFAVALQQIEEITLSGTKNYNLESQSSKYSDLLSDLLAARSV